MRAYKFLTRGGIGLFSDFTWPPPGEWVDARQPVVDCLVGVHALRVEQLLDWIDDELWEVELEGAVDRDSMLVAERGRLVRQVEEWDEVAARAFADACALRGAAVAAIALSRAGLFGAASDLAAAQSLSAVRDAAVAALDAAREAGMGEAVEFAADLASLVGGQRPESWNHPVVSTTVVQTPGATAANAGFVAAHAVGRAALAEHGTDGAYDDAFAAERAAQLSWLRGRLVSIA